MQLRYNYLQSCAGVNYAALEGNVEYTQSCFIKETKCTLNMEDMPEKLRTK